MFDQYGRVEGYGQMAPGRDLPHLKPQGQPGRPPNPQMPPAIQNAVLPQGSTPFQGAQQTIGAQPQPASMGNPMGMSVPGMQADTSAQAPQAQPQQSQQPQNYQSLVMGILNQHGYGPQALLSAEQDLLKHGIQIQKDTPGNARGRIKLPSGDIVDIFDPREGRTEAQNWLNNPIANGQWNWNFLGQQGLDAGGWSFNGPGGPAVGGTSPNFQSAILGQLTGHGENFSEKLREQIMQSLQTAGLSHFLK